MGQVFMTNFFADFADFFAEFLLLEGDDFELEEVGQTSRCCKHFFLRRDFLVCSELLYIHICFYMYTYGCEPGNTGPRIIKDKYVYIYILTNLNTWPLRRRTSIKTARKMVFHWPTPQILTVDGIYGNAWGLCRLG